MDNRQKRNHAIGRTLDALKHTTHARDYCVDDATLLGLAALVDTWSEQQPEPPTRNQIVKFLESLKPFVPSLFQNRPPDLAKIEKLIDPLTGREPENPWVSGDLASQSVVSKHFPQLSDELKKRAKHGGSLSYAQLIEERRAEETAKMLRELEYEHDSNPFRGRNISIQSEFRRKYGDAVANFFKHEAETEVRLPWLGEQNLTLTGRIAAKAPALHELIEKSIPVARAWAQDDLIQSEKAIAEEQARRKAAQQLLGQKLEADRQAWRDRVDKLLAHR